MPALVLVAEALTLIMIVTYLVMLSSDGLLGRIFELRVIDPVGRTLIRNAQVAIVLGYGGFFTYSIVQMFAG